MSGPESASGCLLAAWDACSGELHGYLRHRCARPEDAEEILQEVFIKALRQGAGFAAVKQPRAWFFHVARNALADRLRHEREHLCLPDDIPERLPEEMPAVDSLSQCLPRVLSELSADDRLAITFCDIEGHSQQALADKLEISLSGAKSRVQRARLRLRECLVSACQVRFDPSGEVCCFVPRPPLPDPPEINRD